MKKSGISEVCTVSIITLMMKAVCISEMLVCFYETAWCHIPEGCHLQHMLFLKLGAPQK
jgi:hypothetical protein